MRKAGIGLFTLALSLGALVYFSAPVKGLPDEQALWRHRNLGKALYETPGSIPQAVTELKKALDLAPDSLRDRLNYGLALLRAGKAAEGIAELEKVQKLDPSLPHTWFNLGIAYKHQDRLPEAARQFEQMVKLVPDEPISHYNLGLLYELQQRQPDAVKEFQLTSRLDPALAAPKFRMFNAYRRQGDDAAAAKALAEFREAKKQQEANDESQDVEWSFYAELYDPSQAHPGTSDASAPVLAKFEDHTLPGRVDGKTAGLLAIDSAGRQKADLLVWSGAGIRLYRDTKDVTDEAGLGSFRQILGAAAGDFDNDGLVDLCVLTEGGPHLLHNIKGRFVEQEAALPKQRFDAAVWVDFDHDYDLDLMLLGTKPVLLRNEAKGGLVDYTSHFPFAAGHATGAAVFRVVPDTKGFDIAVTYADHSAVLYQDQLRGVYEAKPLEAVPAGASGLRAVDADNDSWLDLVYGSANGVVLAHNRNGTFQAKPVGNSGAFTALDVENRGLTDIAGSAGLSRSRGLGQFGAANAEAIPTGIAMAAADFDEDGRMDVAEVRTDGSVHLLLNRTVTRNSWLRMALTGVKNLKAAPGTEVEVKSGDAYQKKMYDGTPLVFGLGGQKTADAVRITWANGMIQNEANQVLSKAVAYTEAPRMSGSCPMIFTWNGKEFQFITDVLGVAPLGAGSGDGQYFPVDHDEYIQIPGDALKLQDGRYEVRITEELHEVSYLDKVQLIAVDHPSGVEIFTNDKFKSPPFPEFRLFGVTQRIYPERATDDQGRNLRSALLRQDRHYATGFTHDFSGVAGMHSLTMDFGAQAAPDNKAVLLLNGWVDWADGSTFVGNSQGGGAGLVFPSIQVKDLEGKWRTVVEDMGIPSGKPKTIAVDLTDKFLSSSREVRIVTNLCVFWDEIFLSSSTEAPSVQLTSVDAELANLRLRGFSVPAIDAKREQPENFQYSRWTPAAMWNPVPGQYTRYGDVRELVVGIDDKPVIMGSGDELRLLFPAVSLPALPRGWQRDFLLLVDGWAKDADANTAYSQTVEPLPFHGMSAYPYPPGEKYPDDAAHLEYRRRYNTRAATRCYPG